MKIESCRMGGRAAALEVVPHKTSKDAGSAIKGAAALCTALQALACRESVMREFISALGAGEARP